MRIVLDTNSLLQVLPYGSTCRCVWDAFLQGVITLCYSTEILNEYEEILSRFYSPAVCNITMEMLLCSPNVVQCDPAYRWHLITSDPDDDKFVDCALNSGAACIVTNDHHFDVLKHLGFPPINVFDLQTFCGMIV
jgi:putative PIN family toxin of toxin-antitoxin system